MCIRLYFGRETGKQDFVANYGTPSCAVYRYEAEKLVQESVLREKNKKPYPLRCIDTGGGLCVSSG